MDGGQFTARVPHLKANTTYECRAYSGDQVGDVVTFSTTETGSVPNMGFEDWHQEEKVICPWAQDGTRFWDTGNHGSTTLSEKIILHYLQKTFVLVVQEVGCCIEISENCSKICCWKSIYW